MCCCRLLAVSETPRFPHALRCLKKSPPVVYFSFMHPKWVHHWLMPIFLCLYTVIKQFVQEGGIPYHYCHAVDQEVHVYEAFQNEAVYSSQLFQLFVLQPVKETKDTLHNHYSVARTQHCCKGDTSSQWEITIFGHLWSFAGKWYVMFSRYDPSYHPYTELQNSRFFTHSIFKRMSDYKTEVCF